MFNNIKSNIILKKVFIHLKKRIKYLLLKHNKFLLNKLNIQLKNFQEYKSLKALNEKYQLKIANTDVDTLNLIHLPIDFDNEGLKYLSELEFTELKELNLSENKITDLEPLLNMKLENLEILILSYLNRVGNSDFKKLKEEKTKDNYMDIFNKIKFIKLKKLDLSRNENIDIDSLLNINFNELIELNLRGDFIRNIKVLKNVNFPKLENLYLGLNRIYDIEELENLELKNLLSLDLDNCHFSKMSILEKVKFEKLKLLDLSWNKISDICSLEKVNFIYLENLI